MRHLVLLNPHAHAGRAGRLQSTLAAEFQRRGLRAEFRVSRGPGDATQIAAGLAPGEVDAVIAAGGDGTLFEVVNGLMTLPAEQRPVLGVLPLGTGNAFARDLGLEPGDWEGGMGLIAAGDAGPVDVASVECRDDRFWFINILGIGFVVDAALTAQRLKPLGRAAYTLAALARLVNMPSYPVAIEADGKSIGLGGVGDSPGDGQDGQATFFVEIANSRYTGTRFCMAPGAKIDDGLLDVVVARRLSRRRALALFPTIYDGRHVEAPEVLAFRAREVRLESPSALNCAVDGEFRGNLPLTIRCQEGALEVFAPPET